MYLVGVQMVSSGAPNVMMCHNPSRSVTVTLDCNYNCFASRCLVGVQIGSSLPVVLQPVGLMEGLRYCQQKHCKSAKLP